MLSPPRSLVVSLHLNINSDGVLDEQELEALFTKEVSVLEEAVVRRMPISTTMST